MNVVKQASKSLSEPIGAHRYREGALAFFHGASEIADCSDRSTAFCGISIGLCRLGNLYTYRQEEAAERHYGRHLLMTVSSTKWLSIIGMATYHLTSNSSSILFSPVVIEDYISLERVSESESRSSRG